MTPRPAYPSTPAIPLAAPRPTPSLPPGITPRKVLLLGLDGLRPDHVPHAPHLHHLAQEGMFAVSPLYCSPAGVTGSGSGWATVLSGVWPDRNTVRDGNLVSRRAHRFPDLLTRLKQHDPRHSTAALTCWTAFHRAEWYGGPILSGALDLRIGYDCDTDDPDAADAELAELAAEILGAHSPDLLFVHFGSLDLAGHAGGASLPRYAHSLAAVDRAVGRLLDTVRARPTYAAEDWLILVTNDHGHQDIGDVHNGPSPAERGWCLIAHGAGIAPGSSRPDVRTVDVAPTALHHLGVPLDPAWGLDGRPVQQPQPTDPFDTLLPDLSPAYEPLLIPLGTCGGATPTPPQGWTTHTAHPDGEGHREEWSGWRFTTDPHWTAQDRARARGRETFVRARGVFAVADAALWRGRGDGQHGAPFDATLTSETYETDHIPTLTVDFIAHYRQHGDGRATLTATFDDGPELGLLRFGPSPSTANHGTDAVARPFRLHVDVPPGARTLRLHWRLTTTGSGWFAVDGVRVSPGRLPSLTLTTDTALPEPGTDVLVTATAHGELPPGTTWHLDSELDWPSVPLAPGRWLVAVPADAARTPSWLTAEARWPGGGTYAETVIAVPYADPSVAKFWTATAPTAPARTEGGADGGGRSWPPELRPAAREPFGDAILCGGQAIRLSGTGSALTLLAGSAFYPGGGPGAVLLADGTRHPFDLHIPAWDTAAVDSPHPVAASAQGQDGTLHLYRITVPLPPHTQVTGILLPDCSDRPATYSPSPYVFDIRVESEPEGARTLSSP
ncbi:alkaline phosphatase family protein [Streptomyces sp. NPDC087440]|uniref:alkaline phosphatase family protein n=1 Tax=Streptomyces sp. NPDC087440 TaxID=3365790 RepID=UPI0038207683